MRRFHRVFRFLLPLQLLAALFSSEAASQARGGTNSTAADPLARRIAAQTILRGLLGQGRSAQALELPDLPLQTRLASAICCGPSAASPEAIQVLVFNLEVLDGLSEVADIDRHIAVATRYASDTSTTRVLEYQNEGARNRLISSERAKSIVQLERQLQVALGNKLTASYDRLAAAIAARLKQSPGLSAAFQRELPAPADVRTSRDAVKSALERARR